MRHKKTKAEGRPFVAWRIMADMLRSFDDGQIRTMESLILREKARRHDPVGMGQFSLFGGQAIQSTMEAER